MFYIVFRNTKGYAWEHKIEVVWRSSLFNGECVGLGKKKLVRWGTGENTDCYSALGRWLEKSNLMSLSREEHVVP